MKKPKQRFTKLDILQIIQIGLIIYLILQFLLYVFSVITPTILISSTLPVLIVYLFVRSVYDERRRKKSSELRTRIAKLVEIVEKRSTINQANKTRKEFSETAFEELSVGLSEPMKDSIRKELQEKGIDILP